MPQALKPAPYIREDEYHLSYTPTSSCAERCVTNTSPRPPVNMRTSILKPAAGLMLALLLATASASRTLLQVACSLQKQMVLQ